MTEQREIEKTFTVNAPRWTARALTWLMRRMGARHTTSATLEGPVEEWRIEKHFEPGSQNQVHDLQEDRR